MIFQSKICTSSEKRSCELLKQRFPFISVTLMPTLLLSEAATGGVLSEKVFLEISQNSQENT